MELASVCVTVMSAAADAVQPVTRLATITPGATAESIWAAETGVTLYEVRERRSV